MSLRSNLINQQFCAQFSHPLCGKIYRCQRWSKILGDRIIIESNYSNIKRASDSHHCKLRDNNSCKRVRACNNAIDVWA